MDPNAATVADRLIELLERHFPEAMVEVGPRDLAAFDAVTLPDPDDRHVLAAALAAEADIICTDDKTGFPAAAAAIAGVQVLTLDQTLSMMVAEFPADMAAVHRTVVSMNPKLTSEQSLAKLEAARCHHAAAMLTAVVAPGTSITASELRAMMQGADTRRR